MLSVMNSARIHRLDPPEENSNDGGGCGAAFAQLRRLRGDGQLLFGGLSKPDTVTGLHRPLLLGCFGWM